MDPVTQETPPIQPPTNGAIPPPATPPTPQVSQDADFKELDDGRAQILSPSAFKRIREKEQAKGRKAQIDELNARAKEHGFETYEAMMLAATAAKRAAPTPKTTNSAELRQETKTNQEPKPPRDKQDRKAWARYEREKEQWRQEKIASQKALNRANRRARELEEEKDRLDARRQLELSAVQAGVKEVDFAVELLHRETVRKSGESQEEWERRIRAIDERKFFEDLRKTRAYLFGETVVPATTGLAGEAAPPPKPGDATRREVDQGKFDARTATDEEYRARLRSLGLTPPSV